MENNLRERARAFLKDVETLEIEQKAIRKSREECLRHIEILKNKLANDKEALDIATHAIDILTGISDKAVKNAFEFMEKNLNTALARMFAHTTRQIKIKEYVLRNQYPQLILELHVGNGVVRSLKSDSGHGIAQVVSLLCILALIVITGSRRVLVLDEVLSGVSVKNRMIIDDILWSFTEIGFQFIINEHGYVPKNSYVYYLEMSGDVSSIKREYMAQLGIYLQNKSGDKENPYDKNEEYNLDSEYEEETLKDESISSSEETEYYREGIDLSTDGFEGINVLGLDSPGDTVIIDL